MAVRLGGINFTGFKIGTQTVTALRLGTQLIWTATQLRDDFDQPDGPLDPAKWTRELAGFNFDIGITNNAARVAIPDGLLSVTWGLQTSKYRLLTGVSDSDDGYLEFEIDNKGTWGYNTQLYRRYANTGGGSGVCVGMINSRLYITRRVGGVDTNMKDCGSFTAGDVIRFVQAGNLHTVYRNGELGGEWDDAGQTALKGASNRSIAMLMQGEKAIFMPREFSPSINYLEAN